MQGACISHSFAAAPQPPLRGLHHLTERRNISEIRCTTCLGALYINRCGYCAAVVGRLQGIYNLCEWHGVGNKAGRAGRVVHSRSQSCCGPACMPHPLRHSFTLSISVRVSPPGHEFCDKALKRAGQTRLLS